MKNNLHTIIVTGASGFIGKYLLDSFKEHYYIFAIARRSMVASGIIPHRNIQWIQWDITNEDSIEANYKYLENQGAADYMIHLAGYYDYDYVDKEEYNAINIRGTEMMLELCRKLRVKRFLFASSLTVCEFPENGGIINEKSEANAGFPYAVSKRICEQKCQEYTPYFNVSIIRFAAVFSDWCEFAPLYKFLDNWLARKMESRILGGKGESAISYIYINDLLNLLRSILKKDRFLPAIDTYIASPDHVLNHKDLYQMSTRSYFGKEIKPLMISRPVAYIGLVLKSIGYSIGLLPKPFERLWMLKYIDRQLSVDTSYTQKSLGWKPVARYDLKRRLIFMLINKKTHSGEWKLKNEAALKHVGHRVNLLLYDFLIEKNDEILDYSYQLIIQNLNSAEYKQFYFVQKTTLKEAIQSFIHLILATIRNGDKGLIIKHTAEFGRQLFSHGIGANSICSLLNMIDIKMSELLQTDPKLRRFKSEIYDNVKLSIQLMQDVIEDTVEEMDIKKLRNLDVKEKNAEVESRKLVLKLVSPYQTYEDEKEEKEEIMATPNYNIRPEDYGMKDLM